MLATTLLAGCTSISDRTHAYLGSPQYPASSPESIQILQSEPAGAKDRLGEITLIVDGEPRREQIEAKLKKAAARLGADAVFVVHDKLHIFPIVYADWWWGPMGVTEESQRRIVAVAIKYK